MVNRRLRGDLNALYKYIVRGREDTREGEELQKMKEEKAGSGTSS